MSKFCIPWGHLAFDQQSGRATLSLSRDRVSHGDVEKAMRRLASLESDLLWSPTEINVGADCLELAYPEAQGDITPLVAVVTEWREHPSFALWQASALARWVLEARSELGRAMLDVQCFPITPLQIFRLAAPEGKVTWRAIVVPAPKPRLRDWLDSDEDGLGWLSGDELSGTVSEDRAFLAGSVLYWSLAAARWPESAPFRERLNRLLCYRNFSSSSFAETVYKALPDRASSAGQQLLQFVTTCHQPRERRGMQAGEEVSKLERIDTLLNPVRFACDWADTGDFLTARRLLETAQRTTGLGQEGNDLLRAFRRIDRNTLQLFARLTEDVSSHLPDVSSLIASLREETKDGKQLAAVGLSEEERLCIAYMEGRYLKHEEEARVWLQDEFRTDSLRALGRLLMARLHVGTRAWREAEVSCNGARMIIEKLPEPSSGAAPYLLAYCNLLHSVIDLEIAQSQGMNPHALPGVLSRLEAALSVGIEQHDREWCGLIAGSLKLWVSVARANEQLSLRCLHAENLMRLATTIASEQNSADTYVAWPRPDYFPHP